MTKSILIFVLMLLTSCNAIKLLTSDETEVDQDFYDGVCSSGSCNNTGGIYLNLTYPIQRRTHYVDDETGIRSIGVTYDSTALLECSNDAGVTYSICTGNSSYTWAIADYNIEHRIRVSNNGDEFVASFTPSQMYSGLTFVSCTVNITANETFASYNTRTFVDGDVVCFDDNVSIYRSGTHAGVTFANNNVTLIARTNYSVDFTTLETGITIMNTESFSNINLVGIKISGSGASQTGLDIQGSSVDLEDVTVSLSGNPVNALKLATNGSVVNIRYSYIQSSDTSAGNALYANNSDVYAYESTFESGYQAAYFWKNSSGDYTINSQDSTFIGKKTDGANGSSPGVVATFSNEGTNAYNINFNNSKIWSDGGPAIVLRSGGGIVNVSLSSTALERQSATSYDGPAILVENMAGTNTISASTDSYVCNVGTGVSNEFTSVLSDLSALVTFDPTTMTAHTSNTDINTCP